MGQGDKATTIALDAMGGDLGPSEIVAGAVIYLKKMASRPVVVTLVGDEKLLKPGVADARFDKDARLKIFHASEIIGMDEKPIQALKHKKDASMVRAVELVKEGTCEAVMSCGNTGALMACGLLKIRPMPGVERPALGTFIPDRKSGFILLDVGANSTNKPEHLVHYAILGSHYARIVLGQRNPRVGLLSIGTEESKGNELIHETNQMLKSLGGLINYTGPIEGFNVFDNVVDVIVCDGFVGNVIIKTCKSLYGMLTYLLNREMKKNPVRLSGAMLAKGAFKALKKQCNPDQFGSAPLLGLNGHVFKAHGSSNRNAIAHGLRIACDIIARDMNNLAAADIAKANEIIRPQMHLATTTA